MVNIEAFKLRNDLRKEEKFVEEKSYKVFRVYLCVFYRYAIDNNRFCERPHIDASVLSKVVNFTPSYPSMCRVSPISDGFIFASNHARRLQHFPPPRYYPRSFCLK